MINIHLSCPYIKSTLQKVMASLNGRDKDTKQVWGCQGHRAKEGCSLEECCPIGQGLPKQQVSPSPIVRSEFSCDSN